MLKTDSLGLQFGDQKTDEQSHEADNTVSVNLARRTILMYRLGKAGAPVELAFQNKYGDILDHWWYGDGYMMIVFSKGYLVSISTHEKEVGEELNSNKIFDELTAAYASTKLNMVAAIGKDTVKVLDLYDWKEVKSDTRRYHRDDGEPESLQWSDDGQILTVATTAGNLFNYLMCVPALASSYGDNVAYLSSLRTVTVATESDLREITSYGGASRSTGFDVNIDVEPGFLSLGPSHIGVGMNNHAWFYEIKAVGEEVTSFQVSERDYMSSVKDIQLNGSYAAVLCGGKVNVHTIRPTRGELLSEVRTFPGEGDSDLTVTSMSLTDNFLICATSNGAIHHVFMEDFATINEYRHTTGTVERVYPNKSGTRLVFVDNEHKGFVLNPVDNTQIAIPKFPPAASYVLWDTQDKNVFCVADTGVTEIAVTYILRNETIRGQLVSQVSVTKVSGGVVPILMTDGEVYAQKPNGEMTSLVLTSHDGLSVVRKGVDKARQTMQQFLALGRLKDAWTIALKLHNREIWLALARKAMEMLDVDLAVRVYRELKDASMVQSLEKLLHLEDKNLICGHLCLLAGDYNSAQKHFLSSSGALAALQMRRDLLHWNHALKLAETLSPEQIPEICREYAQQLEFKGEYDHAFKRYEQGVIREDNVEDRELLNIHNTICRNGIIRTTIRLGDVQRGKTMALQSGDKKLMLECASILESMNNDLDAAVLYVKAEAFEKAAAIYIRLKDFHSVSPIMRHITTPKLHYAFAQAKEHEGSYIEAVEAYEKARDMDSVIRICLKHINQPQRAFDIVRKTRSAEGARLIVEYCQSIGDFQAAIEFLLMAQRSDDAFALARDHNQMDAFIRALGSNGATEEYLNVALYYESQQDYARAGDFYLICGEFKTAMRLYVQCGTQRLDQCIELIRKAKMDKSPDLDILIHTLQDFLIGETDGEVKDPHYIFRLYMAIGDFQQAANTALLIANQEQEHGKYKDAHRILFETQQELVAHNVPVREDIRRNLLLLHSYILVKQRVKQGDHVGAAQMLMRVAKSISKFPGHVVPILTSTVIECQRAGLKRSSYEYAAMLMRKEYRAKVDPKYRKKIEAIVRRPPQEEPEEEVSPCPFCDNSIPKSLVNCPFCKNSIPFCVTTGLHMVPNDWCECPSCNFPSLYSQFVPHVEAAGKCPMCSSKVDPRAIRRVHNAKERLLKHATQSDAKSVSTKDGERASSASRIDEEKMPGL